MTDPSGFGTLWCGEASHVIDIDKNDVMGSSNWAVRALLAVILLHALAASVPTRLNHIETNEAN